MKSYNAIYHRFLKIPNFIKGLENLSNERSLQGKITKLCS